jgi:hypothetical protein
MKRFELSINTFRTDRKYRPSRVEPHLVLTFKDREGYVAGTASIPIQQIREALTALQVLDDKENA